MASYLILAALVQALLLQAAHSQCVNRVVPNCAPILDPLLPIEAILNNQLLGKPGLALAVPNAQYVIPGLEAYAPAPAYQVMPSLTEVHAPPTVIQDSSVANNLANALQLLVVSNLLSATLPGCGCEPGYIMEPYMPVGPYGPYSYIY